MASVQRKFTIIKLLGAVHELNNFDGNAFPKAFLNEEPSNPFQNLTDSLSIEKVIIQPDFCSISSNSIDCIPDDTYVTLNLPNTQLTFDFGFAVEFHSVKFDGNYQLDLPNTDCQGEFCSYCPTVTIEDG